MAKFDLKAAGERVAAEIEAERKTWERAPDWELRNVLKALNMLPMLNTPADNIRALAVDLEIKRRRAAKRKGK